MLLLTSTGQKIQVVTSTTLALHVTVSAIDMTTTATTPVSQYTSISSATTTDVLAAPAASTYRQVKLLTIRNTATSGTMTVTVQIDVSGTDYEVWKGALLAGEALVYCDGQGWQVLSDNGRPQTDGFLNLPAVVLMAKHFATANLTSTKTITSTNTFAIYMGRAPSSRTAVSARFRVTTAAATITWAEVAIAKGAVSVGGSPTLQVIGYLDVAAVINSTGQKTAVIPVSAGQSLNVGDDLWFLIGNQATTAAVVRAQSIADDLQVGLQASAVQRPSLIVGTSTAFTVESATTLGAWAALVA